MGQRKSGSKPLDLVGGVLAFVLSAIMGVAFVLVVNKTHDLFSSAALEHLVPELTAVKSQIGSKVRYVKSQISNLRFDS